MKSTINNASNKHKDGDENVIKNIVNIKAAKCRQQKENRKWRKPVLPGKSLKDKESSMETQQSGIYCFSFGDPHQDILIDSKSSNADNNGGFCSLEYVAIFSQNNSDTEISHDLSENLHQGHERRMTLPQPLSKDFENEECREKLDLHKLEPLTSPSDVGRLIYLPANTSVHIECQYSQKDDDTKAFLKKENSVVWQLVYIEKMSRNASSASISLWPHIRKPIMCLHCQKTFQSISIARQHIRTMHRLDPLLQYLSPIQYIYQDEDVVIIAKPQGVSVMGEADSLMRSDILLPKSNKRKYNDKNDIASFPEKDSSMSRKKVFRKPKPVHRLDSSTGGLLVLAKNKDAESKLKISFSKHEECRKRYRAIVIGKLTVKDSPVHLPFVNSYGETKVSGKCDYMVDGKHAMTYYNVVCYSKTNYPRANGWITTLDVWIVTGRKHQIRKHMKLLGHPIWGDSRYGGYNSDEIVGSRFGNDTAKRLQYLKSSTVKENPHSRLCLWALEIILPHPITNRLISASIDEPEWYNNLRINEEKVWEQSEKL